MISPDLFISKVKPACEDFVRSPTRRNLEVLNNEVQRIEDNTLDRFQSYILIPLIMTMDSLDEKSDEVKSQLVFTLSQLIGRVRVKDYSALKTILLLCLKQIFDLQAGHIKLSISEELKTATAQCMSVTLKRSSCDILEEFYSKQNSGLIGKVAVACVELINNEKYRKLRINAIECLMSLFYVQDSADFLDIVIRNCVADIVFIFLPKVVQTLVSVANGDQKQGQQLIAVAVKSLGRILCLIFEDNQQDQSSTELKAKDFLELVKSTAKSSISDDENLTRNVAWFGASSRKLHPILKTMTKLRAHSSAAVRQEYATMCCTLIEKCHKNLVENLQAFIETVLALSQDNDCTIRQTCVEFLQKINNKATLKSMLSENLSNLFEIHLIALPRIIKRWEDAEQISEFLLLKGILECSAEDCLTTVLCSPHNLEKFCMCLISALELELGSDLLREEYAIRSISEDPVNDSTRWRKFKNISNEKVIALVQSICEIVGRSTVADFIFDYLMELLAKDTPECNEVILILIMMLGGASSCCQKQNLVSALQEILEERRWLLELQPNQMKQLDLENSRWFVDRTPGLYESAIEIRTRDIHLDDDDADDTVNIADAEFNVLHTCLLLDAIGHFALLMEEQFQSFMYKALHKVIQKAGSSNYVVHQAGMFALQSIQKALKFETIPELIRENSNYISFYVNVSLKRMKNDKSAFDILSVVMRHSSFPSLPYLENIITTILDECSRFEQLANIEGFLKVFHMFLLGVENWSKEIEQNISSQEHFEESVVNVKVNVYDQWMEILNKKTTETEDIEVDINSEEEITAEANEPAATEAEEVETALTKKSLPHHIEIVVKILKEILKFISSKNQMHKILSLECITTGLPLLKDYEDELLPIVHLIWYPFAERFKDKDVIVLNRCFTLLEVLAVHAKDFLLQRTLKDIFPFLSHFLIAASKSSAEKSSIVETQEFKLQAKLLKEYPTLIESMEVQEREFDRISQAMLLYLCKKQPKLLQQYAVESFCKMTRYDCPAVYIRIESLLSDDEMKENARIVLDFIDIK